MSNPHCGHRLTAPFAIGPTIYTPASMQGPQYNRPDSKEWVINLAAENLIPDLLAPSILSIGYKLDAEHRRALSGMTSQPQARGFVERVIALEGQPDLIADPVTLLALGQRVNLMLPDADRE